MNELLSKFQQLTNAQKLEALDFMDFIRGKRRARRYYVYAFYLAGQILLTHAGMN